jgi:hypothetical protein
MGEPRTTCPVEEMREIDAPSEESNWGPQLNSIVAGVTSFPRRMDDFPGERDKPREDRRQSRDRDASKGGEGCNKDLRASATVAGEPTRCRSSE